MEAEERRDQLAAAFAVLDICGMHDGVQQRALGIDEKAALLALDLLACIEAGIIRVPAFSALFTFWLSMMAAKGFVSRQS